MDYALHVVVFVFLFGMLALSLNISSGYTHLISLGHAGFFGLGAYTTAVLTTRFGVSMWINLAAAMVVTGVVAGLAAFVLVRMTDDYFMISTLGIGVILHSIMNNCSFLTRGSLGLPGIPMPEFFGYPLTSTWQWAVLSGMFYVASFVVANNIQRSPLGLVFVGISEDEVFCQSLGKNVTLAKMRSFVPGAMLASIPGVLYAHYVSYIDPTSFTAYESIFILSIVIVGGLGNLWGSLAAAAFMVFVPELLRLAGLPSSVAASVRQMIFGILLMVVVINPARRNARVNKTVRSG